MTKASPSSSEFLSANAAVKQAAGTASTAEYTGQGAAVAALGLLGVARRRNSIQQQPQPSSTDVTTAAATTTTATATPLTGLRTSTRKKVATRKALSMHEAMEEEQRTNENAVQVPAVGGRNLPTPIVSTCPSPAPCHRSAAPAPSLDPSSGKSQLDANSQNVMTPAPSVPHLPLASHRLEAQKDVAPPSKPLFLKRSTCYAGASLPGVRRTSVPAILPSAASQQSALHQLQVQPGQQHQLGFHRLYQQQRPCINADTFCFHKDKTFYVGDGVRLVCGKFGILQRFFVDPAGEKMVYLEELLLRENRHWDTASSGGGSGSGCPHRSWSLADFVSANAMIAAYRVADIETVLFSTSLCRPAEEIAHPCNVPMQGFVPPPVSAVKDPRMLQPSPETTPNDTSHSNTTSPSVTAENDAGGRTWKRKRTRSWSHPKRSDSEKIVLLKTVLVQQSDGGSSSAGSSAASSRTVTPTQGIEGISLGASVVTPAAVPPAAGDTLAFHGPTPTIARPFQHVSPSMYPQLVANHVPVTTTTSPLETHLSIHPQQQQQQQQQPHHFRLQPFVSSVTIPHTATSTFSTTMTTPVERDSMEAAVALLDMLGGSKS